MATATRKTTTRNKPKSEKNASAKRVRRTTRAKHAAKTEVRMAPKSTAFGAKYDNVADDMMKMSTDAIQKMFKGTSADMSGKMMSMMNPELAKSADAASRSMNELMSISKEGVDACVASGNVAVSASKHMGAELFNYANRSFSQNVELSKELLACRTLNDMFDLQSKMMKANLDGFFSESVKMSELMFECATRASEPLNKTVAKTTKQLSKVLTDAA